METIKALLEKWDILGFVVAGFIGAIIMLLIEFIKSLFSMKRKKYCISKALVSSTVYQQMKKDGLKISVSFNDVEIEDSLTVLKIRLRNDGAGDLMYSQRISYLHMILEGLDVVDVSVETDIEGVNPHIVAVGDNKYEIKWDLLKRDEYFYIKILAKGEIKDMSGVSFDIRADGINQIKTPEYKVVYEMIPVLGAVVIVVIPIMLFLPPGEMFINLFPMKWLYVGCEVLLVIVFLIGALKRRRQWVKEK